MVRTFLSLSLVLALAACGGAPSTTRSTADAVTRTASALSGKIAKHLFGAEAGPTAQTPSSFGSYARGCLAGAAQLPETGPTWQAMRLSRNRNWGHPELVSFVQDLSRKAATLPGWRGIYVGDMSQPRGGPMLTGHASHQIGLDADIWMLPPQRLNLSRAERENISSISLRRANGAYTNENWTRQHMELMKAAAQDPRVARIFVFPGAKVAMCDMEKGDRAWLRKIRPWYGHHYHFHVRLNCPSGAVGCSDQDAPPPDPNAPKPQPRRELTLADLPAQCETVLSAR